MNLLLTTETACMNLATSASVTAYESLFSKVNYYTGIDNAVKAGPCVICVAHQGTPCSTNNNVGMYVVPVEIIVKERASKVERETTTLADTIFTMFQSSAVETELMNNAEKYFVADIRETGLTSNCENKFWIETLTLDITCCKTT